MCHKSRSSYATKKSVRAPHSLWKSLYFKGFFYAIRPLILWHILGSYFLLVWRGGGCWYCISVWRGAGVVVPAGPQLWSTKRCPDHQEAFITWCNLFRAKMPRSLPPNATSPDVLSCDLLMGLQDQESQYNETWLKDDPSMTFHGARESDSKMTQNLSLSQSLHGRKCAF